MNWTAIQDALYDFVDDISSWNVEWAEQNSPASDDPYITMRLTTVPKVGQDDHTLANASGVVTVTGNREFILGLQAFGPGAMGQLR